MIKLNKFSFINKEVKFRNPKIIIYEQVNLPSAHAGTVRFLIFLNTGKKSIIVRRKSFRPFVMFKQFVENNQSISDYQDTRMHYHFQVYK